jgi:uracil-DNA glycosylase
MKDPEKATRLGKQYEVSLSPFLFEVNARGAKASHCFGLPTMQDMSRPRPEGASRFIPEGLNLSLLREAAQACQGCSLYARATQAVVGEGSTSSRVLLVGEQPGDQEDRQGRPFVGPAGALLDRALEEAGINRREVYITNAVKHFKFEERGKRRIHKKPSASEIRACKPWLEAEVALIKPEVIVCLGATAAQSILGSEYRLTKERGRFVTHAWAPKVTSTIHPSAVLRAPDDEQRHDEYQKFVADLKRVRDVLRQGVRSGAKSSTTPASS